MSDEDMVRALLDSDQDAIRLVDCPSCGAPAMMACARGDHWPTNWYVHRSRIHRSRIPEEADR